MLIRRKHSKPKVVFNLITLTCNEELGFWSYLTSQIKKWGRKERLFISISILQDNQINKFCTPFLPYPSKRSLSQR